MIGDALILAGALVLLLLSLAASMFTGYAVIVLLLSVFSSGWAVAAFFGVWLLWFAVVAS